MPALVHTPSQRWCSAFAGQRVPASTSLQHSQSLTLTTMRIANILAIDAPAAHLSSLGTQAMHKPVPDHGVDTVIATATTNVVLSQVNSTWRMSWTRTLPSDIPRRSEVLRRGEYRCILWIFEHIRTRLIDPTAVRRVIIHRHVAHCFSYHHSLRGGITGYW